MQTLCLFAYTAARMKYSTAGGGRKNRRKIVEPLFAIRPRDKTAWIPAELTGHRRRPDIKKRTLEIEKFENLKRNLIRG